MEYKDGMLEEYKHHTLYGALYQLLMAGIVIWLLVMSGFGWIACIGIFLVYYIGMSVQEFHLKELGELLAYQKIDDNLQNIMDTLKDGRTENDDQN